MCLVLYHQYLIKDIEDIVDLFRDQYSQYSIKTKNCRCCGFVFSVFIKMYWRCCDQSKVIVDALEGKTGSERRPLGNLFRRRLCPISFDAENFYAMVIQGFVINFQTSTTIAPISKSLSLTLSPTDIWQVFYKHWALWIVPITPFLLQEDEVQGNNHSTEAYVHPSGCIMQINLVKYFGLIMSVVLRMWLCYE